MSGFFEGLFVPPWKKFGEFEIKTSAIKAVRFYEFLDPSSEKYEHIPYATVYLAGDIRIDLSGENYKEFVAWWQQEKENCGINVEDTK